MAVVPKQNGLEILRKLVPLNTLTEEALAELMDQVAFEKIAKGDYLFREGDTDSERIYLLSGKVTLLEDGKQIDVVTAGSNMARYPLAHHLPRKFSVQAKAKSEVVRIDNRQLSDLLTKGDNALYQVEELNADLEDDWMSQLLQSPIFQRIPAANIQNIMMRMEEVKVTSGEMIIRQGADGDYFYLINQGQCAVTREREDGEIEEIARIGPGHCLGEESLLSGQPRGSTVSMLTDGTLFRLEKKDFIEYIKHPLANAIDYASAAEKVEQEAVWLDVRSPSEHQRTHIPKSRNVPFNTLRSQAALLDTDKTYVVYCQDGLVSSTAVYLLMEQGLDAFVLERGLESVPDEVVKRDSSQESAQIINLRPGVDDSASVAPTSDNTPDDEAGLLRERLQKTEVQAQEQLQLARKMKVMLEKLKGRLAEAEEAEDRESQERQRLTLLVESLQGQLAEREDAHSKLKRQQTSADAQLAVLAAEREQLQAELTKVCQQVGKLEKRLEGKAQDDERLTQRHAKSRQKLQQALVAAEAALEEQTVARQASEETSKALRRDLDVASSELERLEDERQAREAAQTVLVELQAERDELERSRKGLVVALEEAQQALVATEAALEEQTVARQASEEASKALRHDLDVASSELETLVDERKAREATIEALKQDQQTQASSIQALREQQQAHEGALQAAQEAAVTLQSEQAVRLAESLEKERLLTQELTVSQERLDQLEYLLSQQNSNDEGRAERLECAEKEQRRLTAERDQLRAEREDASAQISRLETERSELAQTLQRQQTALESALQQAANEATEERIQAESGLRAAVDERDRLAAELAVLKASHAQLQKQQLEEQAQQAEQARLSEQLGVLGSELNEAECALKEAQAERDRLREHLAQQEEETGRLQAQLGLGERRISELEAQQAASPLQDQAVVQELAVLRAELEEATSAKAAAEAALLQRHHSDAVSALQQTDIKALQAELATLNDALDEADRSYEQLAREKAQLETEQDRLRESDGPGADAALLAQKEAAEQEVARLSAELSAVRAQAESDLESYRSDLKSTAAQTEMTEAPTAELASLQHELDEARRSLKALELCSSTDATESAVLRQDLDRLKRSLEERSVALEQARKEGLLLEEKAEEQNSELDRLKLALEAAQGDVDEALFKKDEALESRKQVEAALYTLQKEVEKARPRDGLSDKRLVVATGGLDRVSGYSPRQIAGGMLIGALLAFVGAEGIPILAGHGELISEWLGGMPSVTSSVVSTETALPAAVISKPDAGSGQKESSSSPVESAPHREGVTQPLAMAVSPKPKAPAQPVVGARSAPVAPKPPPKPVEPVEPETGRLIQDRLTSGGRGPAMLYVRGGAFQMGSRVNLLASEEQPVHTVRLPSFSIGKYEVTFREYARFATATGRRLPDDHGWGQGTHPVMNVSWNEANAYADWLSAQTGKKYRLPTEAEWEFAAAGGTDTPYWWGFDLGPGRANCFNCGSQWDNVSTAPVGQFEANPYGLHNTADNVMEWVADCYHNSYRGAPADGSSWDEARCRERVVRGGAFNKPGESLRVTKRTHQETDTRLFVLGFRLVREVR